MMNILLVASIVLAFSGEPTEAQYGPPPYPPPGYGGPPMWRPERRRWGPQGGQCIYYGDCRGPRYDEFDPPRMPPRPMGPPPGPMGPPPPDGWYEW